MTVRARAINKLHKGATIAEKEVQRALRSYGNHFSAIVAIAAIVATTIAEIDFSSISAIVATNWRSLWSYGNHSPEIVAMADTAILAMVNIPECTA